MKFRLIIVLVIISLLFSISGCNKTDISDLGIVMAVGIDKGEKKGSIKVTAQIALPANARGQTGTPAGGGQGEPIWTACAEGESIFAAIRNLARFASRRIYWAHNNVIVISEEFAKTEGITDVIDFFTRNNQLRLKTWVVVTPAKAGQVVATKTGLEVIPGQSVNKLFLYNQIVAEAPSTNMRILAAAYMSESTHPVLAKVDIKKRGVSSDNPGEFGTTTQVVLSGTAVFDKDKMVGYLTPDESRGLLWFIQQVESPVIPLSCPTNKKKPVSLEIKDHDFSVKPNYKNGKVSFDIKLTTYVDLVELGCATNLENPTLMRKLEKKLEQKLKSEIEAMLKKAQKSYKVDFVKLGETFENHYPAEWIEIRSEWKELFTEAEMHITVKSHINSPSLLENPTRAIKD